MNKKAHPLYVTWKNMKARCLNIMHPQYKDYGGRGITICQEWFDFDVFVTDVGKRPPGKTLDRRNNNLGYSKGNCRWATYKEQAANTREHSPYNRLRVDTMLGVSGVRKYKGSFYSTAYGNVLYKGKDFFEAVAARKSFEASFSQPQRLLETTCTPWQSMPS